jgi:small-conductance mechanosensitive channel
VLTPLDLQGTLTALSTPEGWIELIAVLACFGIGWWVDRKVRIASPGESRVAKLGAGSVNRLIFPLTTLVLLILGRAVVKHLQLPVFFPIFIPLVFALALIRLSVYALRSAFGANRALPVSERTVSFAIWGTLLLYYVGVLPEVGAVLDQAELTLGKSRISLLDLGRVAIAIILALMISLWLSGLIEQWVLRMPGADQSARVVLAKALRAAFLIVGMLVALPMLGIDLTVLSVFGGALGVGIGLGLQKIASNYIAGFTILLDRSIRLGDLITVDNRFGIVSKLTSRYVVVRSLDGIEAIVPNETLVVTTVLNHSYTSRNTRVTLPVQISYDSDLDRAMQLMRDAALAQPRVLRAPSGPEVFVVRFAESGIDLELGMWIGDPEGGQGGLKSAINQAIWKAFRESDIRIPYPQREVRLIRPATAQDVPPEERDGTL